MTKTAPVSRFAEISERITAERLPLCKLCAFLHDAPAEDAQFIRALVADRGKSALHVARVLTGGGVPVSDTSIKRHRATHMGQ